jgi:hypothetical protein
MHEGKRRDGSVAYNFLLKHLVLGVAFLTLGEWSQCSAVELSPTALETELANSLILQEGVIDSNGRLYVVEDGVIYRFIQGKRYRPRCRDQEMERLIPRIFLTGAFEPGSNEVKKTYRAALDRLGHALRWGVLKNYHISIMAYAETNNDSDKDCPPSRLRTAWVRDYLAKRWGIPKGRLFAVTEGLVRRYASKELQEAPAHAEYAKPNALEVVSLGMMGQELNKPCQDGSNAT